MLAEVGTVALKVEYYSIDEFFWEGPPVKGGCYQQSAEHVREHVKARTGLPMTVAYARTRTLAKLFADTAKPFGAVAVTDPDQETELLAKLPVTEIAGVAHRSARKLEPHGIKTCLDLRNASGLLVRRLLTVTGHDLWRELNGQRVTPIRTSRTPHRMLARGGSLAGRVKDAPTLYGWLVRNVERLVEELEFHEVKASALTVHVSYFDDPSAGHTSHLCVPTDRFDLLLNAAKVGLREAWRRGRVATHMHVIASGLRRGPVQLSLFDPPDPTREAVAKVKREVNAMHGRYSP
jgi:DNA polymerase V